MSTAKSQIIGSKKSRSDDTLLTVDFNLRPRNALHSPQSPIGDDTLSLRSILPAGGLSKKKELCNMMNWIVRRTCTTKPERIFFNNKLFIVQSLYMLIPSLYETVIWNLNLCNVNQ